MASMIKVRLNLMRKKNDLDEKSAAIVYKSLLILMFNPNLQQQRKGEEHGTLLKTRLLLGRYMKINLL